MWTYDNAGNILSRTEYAYTTADDPGTALDTVTYAYTSENWGDLLKTYDGGTLYYDYCGNLTSDPTWRYTWEHGRQLATMAAKDGSVTWNYAYDVDGLRLSRTDGTTEYGYVYLGGELVRMTIDDDVVMLFAYDADGTPMSVVYNGTTYYYAKNVQGDVVAILSNTGKPVVYYTYDAWGNILSVTGTKANTLGQDNPLRYRGYVYDTETELYYLQSRYYNPEWGRFISADAVYDYDAGLQGFNLFIYCGNNPKNRIDVSGMDSEDDDKPFDSTPEEEALLLGSGGNGKSGGGGFGGYSAQRTGGYSGGGNSSSSGSSGADTFLPSEWYTHNVAPSCSTPNSSLQNIKINSFTGEFELSTAYYDYAGRQVIRIDWTNHGRADHGNPHVHYTLYNGTYRDGYKYRLN